MIRSNQLQLPGPAELWEAAALMLPETQAAVAALQSQLEALAADPERLLAMQQAGQKLWHRSGTAMACLALWATWWICCGIPWLWRFTPPVLRNFPCTCGAVFAISHSSVWC